MSMSFFKKEPLTNMMESTFMNLPAPKNLSSFWNLGSLLFMCLSLQIVTGILLASAYTPSMILSFDIVSMNMETSNKGWIIRYLHANGASLFFICLYTHIGRGLYQNSYSLKLTWLVGTTIFLMTMAAAFLGYVLPVNQMSFWGASVITNLFSEFPFIGKDLIQFIWGGSSVDNPTITRFYSFHFMIPFMILALAIIHVMYLHSSGSSNPMGLTSKMHKTMFQIYFSMKDILGLMVMLLLFSLICLQYPLCLGDDENFIPADPSVTPHHIQPEWYFLFAYAILRSIPNKLGGVVALLMSVLVLYILPLMKVPTKKSLSFYPFSKIMFWLFMSIIILLTWIGACPVEDPYILVGQSLTIMYFSFFIINPITIILQDKIY